MKLRNKKTGEIKELSNIGLVWNEFGMPCDIGKYKSLAELNEDWEDYKPAEPLIKDEKIRKAVRVWAEANDIRQYDTDVEFDFGEHRLKWIETSIEFNEITGLENLEDGVRYTITELCGEEGK